MSRWLESQVPVHYLTAGKINRCRLLNATRTGKCVIGHRSHRIDQSQEYVMMMFGLSATLLRGGNKTN
jgi:hypothetical protein